MDAALMEAGDTPDLEALFDSVAAAVPAAPAPAPAMALQAVAAAANAPSREPAAADASAPEEVYARIGHMTRALHDTLHELGYDKMLEKAASSIPDARDRLAYIATMTEQAAERVLNATELARPLQDRLESGAGELARDWQRLYDRELSVDEFKALAGRTRDYLAEVPGHTHATREQLTEIMMAQDFQDLTGQVIKRVTDAANHLEQQLVQLLIDNLPPQKRAEMSCGLMNGPVINAAGRNDIVTSQDQVDDLLDSLGF